MSVFPITFSIPKEKIVDSIPNKTRILAKIIPGKLSTYIYDKEKDYYDDYRQSLFAITTRKNGWDCLRHYEIIANGCLPLFDGIEDCPLHYMALFPKSLVKEIKDYYYTSIANKEFKDLTFENLNRCSQYMNSLLEYTREHLTTEMMAKYILDKTQHKHVKKILYLSQDISPDYLRCLTLHGFKSLLGSDCHDYPIIPHLYENYNKPIQNIYGKGMTYTKLLDGSLHNNHNDINLIDDIKNKKYDIVIYGSLHRGLPHFDLVSKIYDKNHIILLCGEDCNGHHCTYKNYVQNGYYCFVREAIV
jgi:hypothetical protein